MNGNHMGPTTRWLRISLMSLTAALAVPAVAQALFVVTMIGTVEKGNLNGTDLSGELFSYYGLILDPTDVDNVYPDIGTFRVDEAILEFGADLSFDFGAEPGYFFWGLENDSFYAYAGLTVDVTSSTYDHGFGFSGAATSLNDFDPNQLVNFGPYDQLDEGWTYGVPGESTFSATNSLGDTLVVESLADFGLLYVFDPEFQLPGDFNEDGFLDEEDVDLLSEAIQAESFDGLFDLDENGQVDHRDLAVWAHDHYETWLGDANLDGEFSSGDLVQVLEAGKFERGISASWWEGDWNGDGYFTTSDLAVAFEDGGYEAGPRTATSAVPEPSTTWLAALATLITVSSRRRRSLS